MKTHFLLITSYLPMPWITADVIQHIILFLLCYDRYWQTNRSTPTHVSFDENYVKLGSHAIH